MPLKVKTQTGLSDVKDLKVKTAEGTLADVQKLLIKADDGTLKIAWERSNPLRMFVETAPNSINYVSIDMVRREYPEYDHYWFWIKVGKPQTPIPTPPGANELNGHQFYDLPLLSEAQHTGTKRGRTEEFLLPDQEDVYWARLFKFMMDRRFGELHLPQLDDYKDAMRYLKRIGIKCPRQRKEIFMTYHLKVICVNPTDPIFDNGSIQHIVPLLDGFKGFPANMVLWFDDLFGVLFGPGQWQSKQLHHFPKLTNSTGAVTLDTAGRHKWPAEKWPAEYFDQIRFPFRWRHDSPTGKTFMRWLEDDGPDGNVHNLKVDPFTKKYGLHDLRNDDEKREAYEVLHVFFHEMGHAIDAYHTLFSSATYIKKDNGKFKFKKKTDMALVDNIGGVLFSCSPAWTRPHGASGWEIVINPNTGKARWEPHAHSLLLKTYYQLKEPATTPDGYDPPVSRRGSDSPREDFAECFACYMLNRNYLREVFPVKFAALEKYLDSIVDFRREVLTESEVFCPEG